MKDQFIPYDQALKLKELGFNEDCLGHYINEDVDDDQDFVDHYKTPISSRVEDSEYVWKNGCDFVTHSNKGNDHISAPLWQQAFDWFTDHKKLLSRIINRDGNVYWKILIRGDKIGTVKSYSNFEESRQEAQIACLNKLIELCYGTR